MFFAIFASAAWCAKSAVFSPPRQDRAKPVGGGQQDEVLATKGRDWNLLWDGIDVLDVEDAEERNIHTYFATAPHTVAPGSATVGVEVLGLQDTGTNLLAQLLYRNFGSQVVHYDSAANAEKMGVWKHANMGFIDDRAPQAFDNLKKHHVVPLVMVRNPLSWLQSIKKAPYELASCVGGDDWLERPCTHKFPAGYVKKAYNVDAGQANMKYLTGIWARWTENYEWVLQKHLGRVKIIRYEDLVLRTKFNVRQIAEYLNLTLPDGINVVEKPAKDHGEAVGHDEAMQKITGKLYLDEFSEEELSLVCTQLNFFNETLVKFGYLDCDRAINATGAQ